MKMLPLAITLAATLLLSAPSQARTIEMLVSAPQTFAQTGPDHLESNKKNIIVAAKSLGWQVSEVSDGQLQLAYDKQGKHQVQLKVSYDASTYHIEYVDSHNMNYEKSGDEVRIHPNYNRWIRNLEKRIHDFSAQ